MSLSKNYDIIIDKNIEYIKDHFSMYKDRNIKNRGGNYSIEYKRLTQARKRLKDSFRIGIEQSLLFSDLISVSFIQNKSCSKFYDNLSEDPKLKLDNFKLCFGEIPEHLDVKDKQEKLKKIEEDLQYRFTTMDQMNKLQVEMIQDVFSIKRMEHLLNEIFRFNCMDYKKILNKKQLEFYAKLATLLASFGLGQIKKFMDSSQHDLLIFDLVRAESIVNMVSNQKNLDLHHDKSNKFN